MGVEWVRLVDRSGSRDERGYRNYRTKYLVKVDSKDDGPLEATDTNLLPALYDEYLVGNDHDQYAIVVAYPSVTLVDQVEDGLLYSVEVEYSSDPSKVAFAAGNLGANDGTIGTPTDPSQTGSKQESGQQPEDRKWLIKFASKQGEQVLGPTDLDDAPVVNTAGQPFTDPPVMVTRSTAVLTITGWRSTPGYSKVLTYIDKCNQGTFLGFPEGTLRCTNYSIQAQYENKKYIYQVEVELEVKPDGWEYVLVLDAGTVELIDGKKSPIADGSGAFMGSVPLNGFGRQAVDEADFHVLPFRAYQLTSFSGII